MMVIAIQCLVMADQVLVRNPDAQITTSYAPVLIHHDDGRILAVGQTEEQLRDTAPTHWATHQGALHVCRPFDPTSFHPIYPNGFLRYIIAVAHRNMRPRFFFWYDSLDRFALDIQITGYFSVPATQQTEFAAYLRQGIRIHRLSICELDHGK